MPNSDVQQHRNVSRSLNVDVLHENGFRRIGPSSLFGNREGCIILSPGIGEGEQGAHQFDIRLVNLEKMNDAAGAALLLRLAPEWFAFFKLTELEPLLTESTQGHGPRSGDLYRFRCTLDEPNGVVNIVSVKDHSVTLSTAMLDRNGAATVLAAMCQ